MDNEFLKSIIGLGGMLLIVALVQLFKPFVKDTRYYPLIAIAWGLLINLLAAWGLGITARADWVVAFIMGILVGLAASGLYSAGSTLKEGDMANKSLRIGTPTPPGPGQ